MRWEGRLADGTKLGTLPKEVIQQLLAKRGQRAVSVDGASLPLGAGTKNAPVYVVVEQGEWARLRLCQAYLRDN